MKNLFASRTTARVALAFSLPLVLGGCSLATTMGLRSVRENPVMPQQQAVLAQAGMEAVSTDVVAIPAPLTEFGKQALKDGNTAAALEFFRRALAMAEPAAPAMNGMGVGYARIGRNDLARKYFSLAAEADPADVRYARNLANLLRAELQAPPPVQLAAPASLPLPERTGQAAGSPRLERVAAREFRIRTIGAGRQPVSRQSLALIESRFRPQVRIALDQTGGQSAEAAETADAPRQPRMIPGFKPLVTIRLNDQAAGNQ